MKSSTKFFGGLFLLIAIGACYRFFNINSFFKSRKDNVLQNTLEIKNNEVISEILVGKWNYEMIFENKIASSTYKGIVTFNEDKTFEKKLTYKLYYGDNIGGNDNKIVSGGTVKGVWQVNNTNFWEEKYTYCNLINSHGDGDVCNHFQGESYFGTFSNNTKDMEITTFDEDNIEIIGKDFSNDGSIKFTFTKIR